MAAVMQHLDSLEIGLCLKINSYGDSQWIRNIFSTVSRLGDGGFWLATGFLMLTMQMQPVLPTLIQLIGTTLIGVCMYKLLKQTLVRERPFITNRAIRPGTRPLDRYSFPSGHTMHATCLTILFTQIEPIMLWVTLPFALLVAASRVVLGLHYPSDVLAGAVLGATLALTSIFVF